VSIETTREVAVGAFLEADYAKGFFLSEENLIKIDDVIRTRVREVLVDPPIIYKIYRKDNFFVDYNSVADVLREENSNRNLIQTLVIRIDTEEVNLTVTFNKKEDSQLFLEADDRDLVFLLGSDLKEYLKSEVFVTWRLGLNEPHYLAMAGMVMVLAGFVLATPAITSLFKSNAGNTARDLALKSNNLGDKLNYLIDNRFPLGPKLELTWIYILIPIAAVLVVSILVHSKSMTNVFYWGKEVPRYNRARSLRDKIFWGVGIALLVGIAGSFLSDMWKPR